MNDRGSKGRSQAEDVPSAAVLAYIAAVLLVAVGLAVLAWRIHPLNRDTASGSHIVTLAVLCLLGFLGSISKERNVGGRIGFSFASIILLAKEKVMCPPTLRSCEAEPRTPSTASTTSVTLSLFESEPLEFNG